MIDALLRIIDRLIQLRQYQDERLKKQFEIVVEPAFAELERVHSDYLKMFMQARSEIAKGHQTVEQAMEELENQRVEFEPVRAKLIASNEVFSSAKLPPPIKAFADAVLAYFPVGDLIEGRGTASSSLINEMSRFYATQPSQRRSGKWTGLPVQMRTQVLLTPASWGSPIECIDFFVRHLREKWEKVCAAVASIRTAVTIGK